MRNNEKRGEYPAYHAGQLKAGVASATDVIKAMTTWQATRASEASYRTLVQQDINALNLLVGEPLPDELLPDSLDRLVEQTIKRVPAGVSSAILLRRPDVLEAEHNLKSVNASTGTARASFFPSVTLTASAGTASSSLSNLFSGGSRIWSFAPSVTLPLFTGGSNLAALHYAEAEKKGYVATYEKTIQTAFSEVADALARRAKRLAISLMLSRDTWPRQDRASYLPCAVINRAWGTIFPC